MAIILILVEYHPPKHPPSTQLPTTHELLLLFTMYVLTGCLVPETCSKAAKHAFETALWFLGCERQLSVDASDLSS